MSQSALSDRRVCGKIIVTGERAICPTCHVPLPGRFPAGCQVRRLLLMCRRCKREFQVDTDDDQRPNATSVH